eukprot:2235303-Amphidinium_carterae.1
MDYGYLLEGAEAKGSMPLWCAKDTKRWFYGAIIPTKELQEVKRQILANGLTKGFLRSDGEHSILALKNKVGEELRRE